MRHRKEFDLERSEGGALSRTAGLDHAGVEPALLQLAAGDLGGEWRRDDGRAQARIQQPYGADVILMRMGDDDRLQPVRLRLDERGVRRHQVDAGRGVHVAECDAAIDHQPAAVLGRSYAVEIHVHADLAGAAERQVHEPGVVGHGAVFRLL